MTKHPVHRGHLGDAFLKHFIFINREMETRIATAVTDTGGRKPGTVSYDATCSAEREAFHISGNEFDCLSLARCLLPPDPTTYLHV